MTYYKPRKNSKEGLFVYILGDSGETSQNIIKKRQQLISLRMSKCNCRQMQILDLENLLPLL